MDEQSAKWIAKGVKQRLAPNLKVLGVSLEDSLLKAFKDLMKDDFSSIPVGQAVDEDFSGYNALIMIELSEDLSESIKSLIKKANDYAVSHLVLSENSYSGLSFIDKGPYALKKSSIIAGKKLCFLER